MPVTVALRGHALTTLQRVLDELDRTSDGDKIDSLLNGYINSASGWLARHCARTFQAGKNIDELLAGNGRTRIRLARPPIRTVATVTIAGAAVAVNDDWVVDDAATATLYRQAGWSWDAAAGSGLDTLGIPGEEKRNVEVVYDGGFVTRPQSVNGGVDGNVDFVGAAVTLPDELEDAVIQLVTSRWRARGRDIRIVSQGFEATALTYAGIPVPADVAAVVADYAAIAHA